MPAASFRAPTAYMTPTETSGARWSSAMSTVRPLSSTKRSTGIPASSAARRAGHMAVWRDGLPARRPSVLDLEREHRPLAGRALQPEDDGIAGDEGDRARDHPERARLE